MKRLLLLALFCFATARAFAATTPSYEGLWWNEPANSQSGWGINISHQGNTLFATWFTYDEDGQPLWMVMPNLQQTPVTQNIDYGSYPYNMFGGGIPPDAIFTGPIYRTNGPYFASTPFDPTRVGTISVGTATFSFYGTSNASFAVLLTNLTTLSFSLTKEIFGTLPDCEVGATPGATPNFTDLWWRSTESGWGVNISQQGNVLFATWFTYDATGRDVWFVMPGSTQTGAMSWSGTLYRTTGTPFDAEWNPSKLTVTNVGSASFNFTDANNGTFNATVNGVSTSKPIGRETFGFPQTVCK